MSHGRNLVQPGIQNPCFYICYSLVNIVMLILPGVNLPVQDQALPDTPCIQLSVMPLNFPSA